MKVHKHMVNSLCKTCVCYNGGNQCAATRSGKCSKDKNACIDAGRYIKKSKDVQIV